MSLHLRFMRAAAPVHGLVAYPPHDATVVLTGLVVVAEAIRVTMGGEHATAQPSVFRIPLNNVVVLAVVLVKLVHVVIVRRLMVAPGITILSRLPLPRRLAIPAVLAVTVAFVAVTAFSAILSHPSVPRPRGWRVGGIACGRGTHSSGLVPQHSYCPAWPGSARQTT